MRPPSAGGPAGEPGTPGDGPISARECAPQRLRTQAGRIPFVVHEDRAGGGFPRVGRSVYGGRVRRREGLMRRTSLWIVAAVAAASIIVALVATAGASS